MLRQIFRSSRDKENGDEWRTKDGINLGRSIGYTNVNDMVFKDHKTGQPIIARYGTLKTRDEKEEFIRFCQDNKGCVEEGCADPKNRQYADKAGYYVEL